MIGRPDLGKIAVRALILLALVAAAPRAPAPAQDRGAPPAWLGDVRLFPAATGGMPDWQKRWWIDKTARLLRGGEGLGPGDDVEALLKLAPAEIARRFMDDARFGDTALDFNLYVLGFKPDSLKGNGVYRRGAFDFANAIAAAQALLTGGDYFKLFDLEGPLYVAPLRLVGEDKPAPEEANLTTAQLRAKAVGELRAEILGVLAFATGPLRPNGDDFCDRVLALARRKGEIGGRVLRAFDDAEILYLTRGRVISEPLDGIERVAEEECDGPPEGSVDVKRLADALKRALDQIDRAFAEFAKFEPAVYRPRHVLEFRQFDLGALPVPTKWVAFGFEQGVALANSSTNYNRKRAAYVLKRFFCDDIVASPPEPPPQHAAAGGPESTCAACHSRLDPMAGFFRGYGAGFYDYSRAPVIMFDDLATAERDEYEGVWRARPGSRREWNIGYIRSPADESRNSYGESLADLSRIIRTAPEAKRCLMRRLFEYLVAEGQMIDAGYLDHLTREFEREAAVNASAAMKNAIVRILESRAYAERNADPRRCYDYAPGAGPEDAPPCRIAHILKKNCAGCHDTAYDGESGLDLTKWIVAPDGGTRIFPHVDEGMRQHAARETFARLVARLESPDPKRRMPKGKIMRTDERDELLRWARDELARLGREAAR